MAETGAIQRLLAAIDQDSSNQRANFDLGREFARQGSYMQAAAQFRRTLELNPDFAEAWLQMGDAYERVGVRKEARVAWEIGLGVARRIRDTRTAEMLERRTVPETLL
jgi:Flp pilus assembly protein TadD